MNLFASNTIILVSGQDDGNRIYDLMKDVLADLGCHYKYTLYAMYDFSSPLNDGSTIRLWSVKACDRGIRANQIFVSDSVDMDERTFDKRYAPWFVEPYYDYALELKTSSVDEMKQSILHPTRWKPKDNKSIGESNG